MDDFQRTIEATALTSFSDFKEQFPETFQFLSEDIVKRIFVCGFAQGAIFGSTVNPNLP